MPVDPNAVVDLLTARVAQVLGRPAAESMRDAALLEAHLNAARAEGQNGDEEGTDGE